MRNEELRKGALVRLYEEDDWFWQGKIVGIDVDECGSVDVDYGDWIQRYPEGSIRDAWIADGIFEEFLAPFHRGVTIQDFRDDAEASHCV